jgi:hypothetical protein
LAERKKQKAALNLTQIKAEEVKLEKKRIMQMDNEDWVEDEDKPTVQPDEEFSSDD